jgi:predicted solute-binding protein
MKKSIWACLAMLPLLAGCDAVMKGVKSAGQQAVTRAVNSASESAAEASRRVTEGAIEKVGEAGTNTVTEAITAKKEEEPKKETDPEKKEGDADKKEEPK